jgi:hypothetical protein
MITSHDMGQTGQMDVEARARQSQGASSNAIYEMVARAIAQRHPGGGVLVDVGCGAGKLWSSGFGHLYVVASTATLVLILYPTMAFRLRQNSFPTIWKVAKHLCQMRQPMWYVRLRRLSTWRTQGRLCENYSG